MEQLIPLIQTAGYLGVFGIVFAESGLLFGALLPGDTLLFAAGLLAAKGFFNVWFITIGCMFAAIAGDSVGYWTGRKFGPRIFKRDDSFFFKKSYVTRAQIFFAKHGRKTIVFARFIPVVRTITPILAGVAGMEYKMFFKYNVIGGIFWCASLILIGYFLGTSVPHIDRYILPIILGMVAVSFIPVVKQFINARRDSKKTVEPV